MLLPSDSLRFMLGQAIDENVSVYWTERGWVSFISRYARFCKSKDNQMTTLRVVTERNIYMSVFRTTIFVPKLPLKP